MTSRLCITFNPTSGPSTGWNQDEFSTWQTRPQIGWEVPPKRPKTDSMSSFPSYTTGSEDLILERAVEDRQNSSGLDQSDESRRFSIGDDLDDIVMAISDELDVLGDLSPSQDPSPVQDPSPLQDPSPVYCTSPVLDASPVKDPSHVQDQNPIQDSSPLQDPSPVQGPSSPHDLSPFEETSMEVDGLDTIQQNRETGLGQFSPLQALFWIWCCKPFKKTV
jgi:hypothetical protein